MTPYSFHPEALHEYAEATRYYLQTASPLLAEVFVASVESAIQSLRDSPNRWRIIQEPNIRRCIVKRFPYLLYYLWDSSQNHITIYAVMHSSREPGYWKNRVR